ncbi:hypothetical protein CJF31_00009326 [Rutstroemia sp. NJR-2017a BVV2]|nr:hypothetical protein CJF31_00009326 [Rutstroemia sp. NJR-2017a BVV2]
MSFPARHSSPPKRPKLSLQIKNPAAPQTLGKSATALKADINPSSPTAFNTLSNAYAIAIENASPQILQPACFDPKAPGNIRPMPSRLQTSMTAKNEYLHPSQRTQTPSPFSISYPDTPSSAHPDSTPNLSLITAMDSAKGTPTITFTPPQSAGAIDKPGIFNFASHIPTNSSPRTARRRLTSSSSLAPYTHPKSLHSILRNSPLPPRSAVTPATPTTSSRLALRRANAAKSKKVGYNNPLTQTITTNKYIKSHIDLLAEDSPHSASEPDAEGGLTVLDTTMRYTGDETRDGGQTPGPFEEMRRRMAESGLETPKGAGKAGRRRRDKDRKRKWRWTIGVGDGEGEGEDEDVQVTPKTAVERTPITCIWRGGDASPSSGDNAEGDADLVMGEAVDDAEGSEPLIDDHEQTVSEMVGEGNEHRYEQERRGHSVELVLTDSESSSGGEECCSRPGTSHSL